MLLLYLSYICPSLVPDHLYLDTQLQEPDRLPCAWALARSLSTDMELHDRILSVLHGCCPFRNLPGGLRCLSRAPAQTCPCAPALPRDFAVATSLLAFADQLRGPVSACECSSQRPFPLRLLPCCLARGK